MVIRTLGDSSLSVETGSFCAFQTLVRMIKIQSDATDGNVCQDWFWWEGRGVQRFLSRRRINPF